MNPYIYGLAMLVWMGAWFWPHVFPREERRNPPAVKRRIAATAARLAAEPGKDPAVAQALERTAVRLNLEAAEQERTDEPPPIWGTPPPEARPQDRR